MAKCISTILFLAHSSGVFDIGASEASTKEPCPARQGWAWVPGHGWEAVVGAGGADIHAVLARFGDF
jgi:hypothetical protein